MENNAVRLDDLHFGAVHDDGPVFHVYVEECHCIRFMIARNKMLVVREQGGVFGIFAGDWKAKLLFERTV